MAEDEDAKAAARIESPQPTVVESEKQTDKTS
jgi:hypothetical protein